MCECFCMINVRMPIVTNMNEASYYVMCDMINYRAYLQLVPTKNFAKLLILLCNLRYPAKTVLPP